MILKSLMSLMILITIAAFVPFLRFFPAIAKSKMSFAAFPLKSVVPEIALKNQPRSKKRVIVAMISVKK